MGRSLEEALAFHCAPALVGLKPANLISCDREQYPKLDSELSALNCQLNPAGIFFRPVCRCGNRVLVLVYRQRVLERHLEDSKVRAFLKRAGYPDGGQEEILKHLQQRLSAESSFPHETGVILGYPVEDVEGFLRHGGKNCKLCGYWKVYSNEARARALFTQFTRCRESLCRLVANGVSITRLFNAA